MNHFSERHRHLERLFGGRQLCIATMHGKEKAIITLMEEKLGVKCFVPRGLNTDLLGTFTGDVERKQGPVETAREKCEMAAALTGCDLLVASEGSFGPHPLSPFFNCDEEVLFFLDKKNGFEIVASEISTKTNFARQPVASMNELKAFAAKTGFPRHGLILKAPNNEIVKGISSEKGLAYHFNFLRGYGLPLIAETDMRAMMNPSRMKVIKSCAEKLVRTIKTQCPVCLSPGFSISDRAYGLPCQDCGMPTKSVLLHRYTCKKCQHTEEKHYPNGQTFENPAYCDYCNP